MNAVRHFPVAEQYPSRTAIVSAFASKRISGIPPPQKITPTPEGMSANAWLAAGVASPGCHAGGERQTGVHSGGLLVVGIDLDEIVRKRLNMRNAGVFNFLPGDLFKRSPRHSGLFGNLRPGPLGAVEAIKNKLVKVDFHRQKNKPEFGSSQDTRKRVWLRDRFPV
jgi:hypothetical protein